jgi:pyruvate kinase
MLKRIAEKTEEFRTLGYEKFLQEKSDWQNIALAARDLSSNIDAQGIIVITRSGETANVISNTKPFRMPVFAFTDNPSTYRQLSLTGGMQPTKLSSIKNQANTIKNVKTILTKKYKMKKGNKFILLAGIFSASHSDSLQIIKI